MHELESVDCLSKFKVSGRNESGYPEIKNETFVKMLVFETGIGHKHYIKFGKEWYEILDEVQKHIK